MIIFVHIPKCAGTSFSKMIESNCKNKFQHVHEIEDWSSSNQDIYQHWLMGKQIDLNPDYCHSHFCHGFHKFFDTEDYDYVTFLRSPVSRVKSAIRFNAARVEKKGNPGIWADDKFCDLFSQYKKNKNSYNFIEKLIENNIMCNQMTKQLSGFANLENISLTKELKRSAIWFPPYFHEKKAYSEEQMEIMLQCAIDNLKSYSFIGLQEDMKGSLKRFKNAFPKVKTEPVYDKLKSTNNKQFNFKEEDIELLEEMNKYDIRLYEAARELI